MRLPTLFAVAALGALTCYCSSSQPAAKPAAATTAATTATGGTPLTGDVYAIFDTSKGKFEVQLFPKDAPVTVRNFVDLAEGKKPFKDPTMGTLSMGKLYDGLLFFRTVPDGLIQTGDPLNTGTGSIGVSIPVETNKLRFDQPGRMGMAQLSGQPDSRGSQIFFALQPAPQLDSDGFLVMGQIVDGMDVAKAISEGPRKPGYTDMPEFPNVLNHVTIQDHK